MGVQYLTTYAKQSENYHLVNILNEIKEWKM